MEIHWQNDKLIKSIPYKYVYTPTFIHMDSGISQALGSLTKASLLAVEELAQM